MLLVQQMIFSLPLEANMKASNCVSNLQGIDRDYSVYCTKQKDKLPSATDLDKIAEEERIRVATSGVDNSGELNGI